MGKFFLVKKSKSGWGVRGGFGKRPDFSRFFWTPSLFVNITFASFNFEFCFQKYQDECVTL